jgi:hypothetical protein
MSTASSKSAKPLVEKAQKWVLEYPGFFTPYKSGEDFLFTFISPILAPVVLGYASCQCFSVSLLLAGFAIPVTMLSIFPSLLFNKPEWIENTFKFMISCAKELLIASACYAGLALVSIVGAPVGLVTRTIASIIEGIMNLFKSETDTSQLALTSI